MPTQGSRQAARLLPTPRVEDLIFFEERKSLVTARSNPKGTTPPYPYGTLYTAINPGTTLYTSHKLVLVEDVDETGLVQNFWYAADRDDQDSYNYSILFPWSENPNFYQVSREYIVPREGYEPDPLGTPEPSDPFAGTWTYLRPDGDDYFRPGGVDSYIRPASVSSGAVLVGQSMQPLEYQSRISSLYVRVTKIYQKIPGTDDSPPGSGSSQNDRGYVVTRIYGGINSFRLVWTITLPRTVADNYKAPPFTNCIIPGYENLLLVNEKIEASNENNQTSTVTRIYEGNISGDPFPSADRIYYSGTFYPGNLPPDKFVVSKRKVVTEVTISTPESESTSSPSTSPETTPSPKYSRLESVEAKPGQVAPQNEGTKEVTYWTDIETAVLSGNQWDNTIRDYVPYVTFVLPSDAYPLFDTPPQPGTQRDVTPLSTGWFMVTIQSPNETTIEVLASPFAIDGTARSWLDFENDTWPNVLNAETFTTVESLDGDQLGLQWDFSPSAYNGPCVVCKQVAWQKVAPNILIAPNLQAEAFDPTPLRINWPGVINDGIPACLHFNPNSSEYDPQPVPDGAYIFTGPLGTNYYLQWLATGFPTWPESYVKVVRVDPYLGGFRIEKWTVQKPNVGPA